jgi:UDP-N-acetylmuramoylalanine--D-glutamate ligase
MMTRPAPETLLRAEHDWSDLRVAVLGLGRSGAGACRLLRSRGAAVTAIDDRGAEELSDVHERLRGSVDRWLLGGAVTDVEKLDAVVVSPGVPASHPVLVSAVAAGLAVLGELELAARLVPGPIVAVTGTNGKSTTVTLVQRMLRAAGHSARLLGNIGTAISDEVLELSDDEIVVIEASSFQLEWVQQFHPRAAAVLNVAPDHLDRYESFEDYAGAKRRLLKSLQAEDAFVFAGDSERLRQWSQNCAARAIPFGIELESGESGVCVADDVIVLRHAGDEVPLMSVGEIPLVGSHNLLNVMAAFALVSALDIDLVSCTDAVRSFRPLAHRAVDVVSADGVRWIDDSKATNVHAAVATASGIVSLQLWLLGGSGKDEDYSPLREVAQRVETVICFGAEGPRIGKALSGCVDVQLAPGLIAALELAAARVRSGASVLLSPACASFDEFSSFEERGDVFAQWVGEHRGGAG